jgi:hypothetical protein
MNASGDRADVTATAYRADASGDGPMRQRCSLGGARLM